jgi:hypothetical protein
MMPQMFDPGQKDPPRASKTSTAIEALTGIAQVAIAVAAWLQLQTSRASWILGLGVAWLVLAFRRPIAGWIKQQRRRAHDDAIARRAVPELRLLIRRFGEFVDEGNRSDTLRAIIQNGLQNDQANLQRLLVPGGHWLRSLVLELLDRLRDTPVGLNYLVRAGAEFYTIVSAYGDQCLLPIFERLQPGDRQLMIGACGRQLEAFRQRYMGFRDDYEKYVRAVLSNLHATPPLHPILPRTEPLSG